MRATVAPTYVCVALATLASSNIYVAPGDSAAPWLGLSGHAAWGSRCVRPRHELEITELTYAGAFRRATRGYEHACAVRVGLAVEALI